MKKEKYIMKWLDGSKSAFPMTKEQTETALTNWYKKDEFWNHITVVNTQNGKDETFFQDWNLRANEIELAI